MSGPVLRFLQQRHGIELGPGPARGRWRNWLLGEDAGGIAWLVLDVPGHAMNTLTEEVLRELGKILDELEGRDLGGIVLRSAKPGGFAAGADVHELAVLPDQPRIRDRLREAHDVVERLEALNPPTVAVLHGVCVGGGLELALACDRRIAVTGTELGFPEIRLGLHPGLGGTARACHLIDPTEALSLMLRGKSISADKAQSLGLVDEVVEERHVAAAVRAAFSGDLNRPSHRLRNAALSSAPGRRMAANRMRSETAKRARREHYPAPYALIDLWQEHGGDRNAMLEAEIDSFARLLATDTARNLIRVFQLRERLKHADSQDPSVRHVHVIGAGEMGADIAAWCARSGLRVTVSEVSLDVLAGGVKRAAALCASEHLGRRRTRNMLDRLVPDPRGLGLRHADLVIEAVPEDESLKRNLLDSVEPRLKPGAVLATNTSSIPLEALTRSLQDPSRLVGLHFFNPVARMQLVEVVRHAAASPDSLEIATGFVRQIDRLPVRVGSAPGFLVNRALMPYLMEALLLLDEGVEPETVDEAAEAFGMPMGPVELADRVGLDVGLSVVDMLHDRLDGAFPEPPQWFRDRVSEGKLGRKSGEGLYTWKDGKPQKNGTESADAALCDRLILPMLNACIACLREGVVEDQDLVDGAMIFGTGFAPFRGGPLAHARTRGIEDVQGALSMLAERYGKRFDPDSGWAGLR